MVPVAGHHLLLGCELPYQRYGLVVVTSSSGARPPWQRSWGGWAAQVWEAEGVRASEREAQRGPEHPNGRRGGSAGFCAHADVREIRSTGVWTRSGCPDASHTERGSHTVSVLYSVAAAGTHKLGRHCNTLLCKLRVHYKDDTLFTTK